MQLRLPGALEVGALADGRGQHDVGLEAAAGLADVDGLLAAVHRAAAVRVDERSLDIVLEAGQRGVAGVGDAADIREGQALGIVDELVLVEVGQLDGDVHVGVADDVREGRVGALRVDVAGVAIQPGVAAQRVVDGPRFMSLRPLKAA